ncbi:nitroreductase family deazaflavin-dependent oxidoreductase [Planomonospora sp. ID91781]|uniref:nitroreductase family deazaflavin-dependent oxidoreductase n=1 Tax=Planomonospora sp. ID91781 TaxID=2738135 RepID=UPI0018C3F072|nr:nitroreductase family deazaflavin-dependent oxidoreductase [Planomonospora sp. ID91781]MBG0819294.1 nitroreductase family deazaflavin-dependent oxidoreductase [Planomonospora sp. ID91781]
MGEVHGNPGFSGVHDSPGSGGVHGNPGSGGVHGNPGSGEVRDSPDPWVAEHIRRFQETGGRPRPGTNDLLLTTRGRRTGELRRTALVYGRDGDRYVLVASNRGADRHPAWYLNLLADPRVTVQVGTEVFTARARPATAAERPGLWRLMASARPEYAAYRERTTREIPVVLLERLPGR